MLRQAVLLLAKTLKRRISQTKKYNRGIEELSHTPATSMYKFGIRKVSCWLFATGLSLSTATQLRIANTSIGVGEIVLIASLMLLFLRALIRGKFLSIPKCYRPLFLFWVFAAIILIFGYYVALGRGLVSMNAGHDVLAWALIIFMLVIALSSLDQDDIGYVLKYCITLTVLSLSLLFLVSKFYENPLGNVDVMYGPRFRGWAINPNQLAFQLSAMPFFSLFLARGNNRKMLLYALLLLSLILGVSTRSDALIIGWMFSCVLMVAMYASKRIFKSWRVSNRLLKFICYWLLPALILIIILALNTETFYFIGEQDIPSTLTGVYEEKTQVATRLLLWKNGIEALKESPWVGLGPGPHSGTVAPFYDVESHNTFIDWGTSTGVFGLIVYIFLLGYILKRVLRSGDIMLISAYSSVIWVSIFHDTLRHPVFWFYLVAIIGLAYRNEMKRYISIGSERYLYRDIHDMPDIK